MEKKSLVDLSIEELRAQIAKVEGSFIPSVNAPEKLVIYMDLLNRKMRQENDLQQERFAKLNLKVAIITLAASIVTIIVSLFQFFH